MQSEKFIGAVIETGAVDGNFLSGDAKDRLDEWGKMVKVSNNPDVGTLHIEVYDNGDRDALRIAQAVGNVLTEKNSLFRSGDEKSVEIRTLSGPIVEKNPSVERLSLVSGSGFLFGVSVFILFLIAKAEQKSKGISFRLNDLRRGATASSSSAPSRDTFHGAEDVDRNPDQSGDISRRIYPESRLVFDEK